MTRAQTKLEKKTGHCYSILTWVPYDETSKGNPCVLYRNITAKKACMRKEQILLRV